METAWLLAQPESVRRELGGLGALEDPGGEPVVEALLGFPYSAGPRLAQQLVDRGGQQALDAAFDEPPTTTEQVLDPAADAGADVAVPQADGDEVDAGVLGVLGLALLLGTDPLQPGVERGWDGDRYVTTEQDGATCTVADIATDDPSSGAALRAELERWAAAEDDAFVVDGPDGTLRLRSCAPSA